MIRIVLPNPARHTYKSLGEKYGISYDSVRKIIKHRTYKDVE